MFQKSLDSRLGTLSRSTGVGLEPVGTGTRRLIQAPTVGNPLNGVGTVALKLLAHGPRAEGPPLWSVQM
jgi:hypothetical protein